MASYQKVVLGVSLGTRYIGIALFQGKELIDWQMKVFKVVWSKTKAQTICSCIEEIVISEQVSVVAIKIPQESKQGQYVKKLGSRLLQVLKERSINFCLYDVRTLKQDHLHNSNTNKDDLVEQIVTEYPELALEYQKEQKNKNRYYTKVFEAVACAKSYLMEK